MSRSRRVVLDTSVLVSAALRIGSIPHRAVIEALTSCSIYGNVDTLSELEFVLDRSKFDRYLDRETRRRFVSLIRANVRRLPVSIPDLMATLPACRDYEDNKFLALALVAQADVLVSSDEDLLVLNPWNAIPILGPADFLESP